MVNQSSQSGQDVSGAAESAFEGGGNGCGDLSRQANPSNVGEIVVAGQAQIDVSDFAVDDRADRSEPSRNAEIPVEVVRGPERQHPQNSVLVRKPHRDIADRAIPAPNYQQRRPRRQRMLDRRRQVFTSGNHVHLTESEPIPL